MFRLDMDGSLQPVEFEEKFRELAPGAAGAVPGAGAWGAAGQKGSASLSFHGSTGVWGFGRERGCRFFVCLFFVFEVRSPVDAKQASRCFGH